MWPGVFVRPRICRSAHYWMSGCGIRPTDLSFTCPARDTGRLMDTAISPRARCTPADTVIPRKNPVEAADPAPTTEATDAAAAVPAATTMARGAKFAVEPIDLLQHQ